MAFIKRIIARIRNYYHRGDCPACGSMGFKPSWGHDAKGKPFKGCTFCTGREW